MGTIKKLASDRTDFEIQDDLLVRYSGSKTLVEQLPEEVVRIGKNAASVLPDAVEAVSRTFSSVPKIAFPAAFCTARSVCQPDW